MSINLTKLQMSSFASSQQILKQGSGSFAVPALAAAGGTYGSVTIAHGGGTDNLLFQVATDGGPTDGVVMPWCSSDGRISQYSQIDATNLKIFVASTDASGLGAPGFTINYSYRILIP